MARRPMALVRRWLRQVLPPDDRPDTDRDLLRRFAAQRDEAAFAVLVRRHGALVVAAARRVLGDAHAAEDVGQAAFLLLAKKADAAGWQSSVANWLYTTARQLALKVQRTERRRGQRERAVVRQPAANPLGQITAQELLTVLDEELCRLPATLRAPLLLCYFEGATRDEAARRLNCPLATLKRRLARGRLGLRAALARRGLSLPAVLAGGLLAHEPLAVGSAWATAAALLAAGRPATDVVAPAVARLIQEGLAMSSGKTLKIGLAVALVGSLLASAGALAFASRGQPPAPVPQELAKVRKLRVIVTDAQGQPLPGATVQAGVWPGEVQANRDATTDAAGVARVELPATFRTLRMWIGKPTFATLAAQWDAPDAEPPAEFPVRLEPGATTRGRVVDEAGRPVAGASVRVRLATELRPAGGDGRVRFEASLSRGAKTDADGRWQVDTVPNRGYARLNLFVTHPEFLGDQAWRPAETVDRFTGQVFGADAIQVLQLGATVSGRVTDPTGKPVAKAFVLVHGDWPDQPARLLTDDAGRYRSTLLLPGSRTLVVLAPSFAPQSRVANVMSGRSVQDFQVTTGKPIRLRIVDKTGKPVSGASVTVGGWLYSPHLDSSSGFDPSIPAQTNAAGVWEWANAPDGPDQIHVHAEIMDNSGFVSQAVGGEPERTITISPTARATIACRVVDAVTGQPVPEFTVYHSIQTAGEDAVFRQERKIGRAGRLNYPAPAAGTFISPQQFPIPEPYPGNVMTAPTSRFYLRVEAPGYRR